MSTDGRQGAWLPATAILLAGLFAVDRTALALRDCVGSLCELSAKSELVTDATTVSFHIDNPCFATGVRLRRGNIYRFSVEDARWKDGGVRAGAGGLEDEPFRLVVARPFRRHVGQPWMKLMGRVGRTGEETFAIGEGLAAYEAKTSGEVFLYVNDAVLGVGPGRHWALPYFWASGRNAGMGVVTVSLVHGADD